MPFDARKLKKPRIRSIKAEVTKSQFTDGGGTSGTFNFGEQIPAGAVVQYCHVRPLVAWSGDTTAVITVGDGSDVDRYNTGTPSVLAAAPNGIAMGDPSGTKYHAAAATPKITVTGAADFTSIAAGAKLLAEIAFLEFDV